MLENQKLKNIGIFILLLLLCAVPIFGHLEDLAIRIYDESRLAQNAYEMSKNGNWLVTFFDGKPDMWNTKPPLMIWLQVVFIKILGYREMSIRLPSAFAAFGTVLLIYYFTKRYLQDISFGLITILVLITCYGYVNLHVTRTGDYDALLTFFTAFYCLSFFQFVRTDKNKYLYLFFIGLSLAVLTKSIAGLLFLPGLFMFLLYKKKLLFLLKSPNLYLGALIPIFTIIAYYGLREHYNPGFIKAVFENELGGRFLKINEEHAEGFWFYYHNFIQSKLYYLWYLSVPAGFTIGMFHKNSRIRDLSFFSCIMLLSFLLIISLAKTKLEWYDAPLYPFIAILAGIFIYFIYSVLTELKFNQLNFNILPLLFLFFVFIKPYTLIIDKTYMPIENSWDKDFYNGSYYLKAILKGEKLSDGLIFYVEGYNPQVRFYIKMLEDQKVGFLWKDKSQLAIGDKVVFFQDEVKQYLENHYSIEQLENNNGITIVKINGNK